VIEIRLDESRSAFEPGEKLRGEVHWVAETAPRGLALRLLWYTEGRGDRDVGVASRETLPVGSSTGSSAFSLEAPSGPWSCSGQLVSIRWALEAELEPGGEVARLELVLGPGGSEALLGQGG